MNFPNWNELFKHKNRLAAASAHSSSAERASRTASLAVSGLELGQSDLHRLVASGEGLAVVEFDTLGRSARVRERDHAFALK